MKLIGDYHAQFAASLPMRCFWLGYWIGFMSVIAFKLLTRGEAGDSVAGYVAILGVAVSFMVGFIVIRSDGIRPHELKDVD